MEITPTAFVPRRVRIVVLGAGISGIQFLRDATTRLSNIDITVYDKNDHEGGTWAENRYPGCACDIPSHAYQYSWNPNPRWSRLYAEAPEILAYLRSTVDKFNLGQYMQFSTMCTGAVWDDEASQWTLSLQKGDGSTTRETCDILISAVGRLNNWKLPQIHGIERFEGRVIHTADWPRDFDFRGKDIAVIGNGASAVQCVAAMSQGGAKSIDNFVRGPTWLVPHVFSKKGEPQVVYPKQVIAKLVTDPGAYFDFRLRIEKQLAATFKGLWTKSKAAEDFTSRARSHMRRKIKNPQTLKTLLPTEYKAGCRRFTPADAYMEALNQDNVNLVPGTIDQVDGRWVCTREGRRREYDAIVCGTGFQPYTPRFPVVGRNKANLAELWSEEGAGTYKSYLAVTVADFPNFFIFNPPTCPVNGSAYPGIERSSDYMVRVIDRLQKDRLRSVCVKTHAQSAFNAWVQSRMPEMVWSQPCSSWYKDSSGRVIVPWPGTILHYYAATEIVRWEDYDLEFEDETQKYASFGNGVTLEGFNPDMLPWLKPGSQSCSD
ncbi:hypothetical protein NLU13_3417 [Sarocladium strictum]|uniref:Monooxygenase n=1 Tax=Sarocladium strictum TaxID=5046 RepID=A0AA39GNT3_SARSR|nr:hypothetical protein NLU13_3417 [Sarocladium strictum]